MSDPHVSVLTAVYNGATHLATAMDSLVAQSVQDAEFVVVDDGSADDTPAILADYAARDPRVRVLRNDTNLGLTRALNRGLAACRGTYIARLDADDVAAPDRLERQLAWLERNADAVLLGAAYHVLEPDGTPTDVHRQPLHDAEIRWQQLFHNAFCHSSVMWRRNALTRLAMPAYDEAFTYSQDFDLWTRLASQGRVANLPEPLVGLRLHANTISATRAEAQRQLADRVSAREIARITPGVDLATVRTLRAWYYAFPETLSEGDLTACIALLRLIERLPSSDGEDGRIVHALQRRWLARVRSALPMRLLPGVAPMLWRALERPGTMLALAFGFGKA